MINFEKILKFILQHIDEGTIDTVFNEETLDKPNKIYKLEPFGIEITTDLVEDVKKNPEHYRQFVGQ